MEWFLLETLISPETATSFSLIMNHNKVCRIIWHEYDEDLTPGKYILLSKGKFMFEGREIIKLIRALKTDFYTKTAWNSLKAYTGCEKFLKKGQCGYAHRCAIKTCPRQLHQNGIPERNDNNPHLH